MREFFKRFEKLENSKGKQTINAGMRISKRFEILEVGNTRIEVAITDTITAQEHAPSAITYYLLCPYCGRDNAVDATLCLNCRQPLKSKLADDFQIRAKQLKKCTACQAVNQQERKTCWVCGKNFPESSSSPRVADNNVISLSIDGNDYKSTDSILPIDIKILMERIRYEGYTKELIDEWVNKRNLEATQKKDDLQERITNVRSEFNYRRNSAVIIAGCILLFFFSKVACDKMKEYLK